MKVIIPVAGEGTRLRPHTYTMPKALLPVGGKPMLAHVLDQITALSFSEVVFIIGALGDQIKEYIEKNYNFKASFVEQKKYLGLGYAVYLGVIDTTEDVLVVLGDTITELDWQGLVGSDRNLLAIKEVDDARAFGVAEVEGDRIIRLVEKPEKPPSNLAVIGVYYIKDTAQFYECLDKIVKQGITTHGEIQLTDAFDLFLKEGGSLYTFPTTGWHDCGNVETILATNRHLLSKNQEAVKREGSIIVPPSLVDPSAQVERSIIGPYVSLGPETVVRNSIISDSIIFAGAHIDSAVVAGSLIGRDVIVRGNT
ncbi:MAG: NTP transferase domain-containing protein [candidate division Zixibacteria bacterium]|nr:NTP transferase domain-containing protein [candidate division Zixibacteria bacterium]